ncbi:MAG: hypothetical protein VXX91_07500 [Planctomycetota bacterium]|nr:hypothetical protein [Planctomycetota bacterium]
MPIWPVVLVGLQTVCSAVAQSSERRTYVFVEAATVVVVVPVGSSTVPKVTAAVGAVGSTGFVREI